MSEEASLQIKCNQLHHRMQMLLEIQRVYVPDVAAIEAHFASENGDCAGKKRDGLL